MTVLFVDVVGSTALAEQMDAEEWTGVMNRAFSRMGQVIERYEGTIARLMGDALLVFFGAPIAHEDDPTRAAAAALDLVQETASFAEELRVEYGIDFAIRAGLNTGPVVVGEVGSGHAHEYTAMGDAVNLAARLQAAARPMSVFLSENTYRFIAPAFECADLGKIAVKGKSEPVHVYELKAAKQKRALRRGSGSRRGLARPDSALSEMVGREEELYGLLQLSQALAAGLGRGVLITGEPGIGKTRLIAEWRERLQPEVFWAEGRCLSYGRSLAYHLVVDLFRSLLDLPAAPDGTVHRESLQRTGQELIGDAAETVIPYLGHLLGLPLEEEEMEQIQALDPQTLQGHYLRSLRMLISLLAERKPLILVLDDVHWADPSSVDIIGQLLPLALSKPVLFCLVTRPERGTEGWRLVLEMRQQIGAGLTEIHLEALTDAYSDRLVSNLLDAQPLPPALHRLILQKTEGNPLFVEELVHMLIERGTLARSDSGWRVTRPVDSIEIPGSLQSLLLARIDQLPEESKRLLRVAAVIGRQFSVRVLEEMMKHDVSA